MKKNVLIHQRILAVDDEPDVLDVIEEEIFEICPKCIIDKVTSFAEAAENMFCWTYDLVILDIMGVKGFDLLKLAVARNFPVAILTAHALSPEALKKSIENGARSYLPKEKLGELVPFLEDVLRYETMPGWKRLFDNLGDFFNKRFGPDWQKKEEKFWKQFKDQTG